MAGMLAARDALRRALLDGPVALAGFACATALGLAIGLPLSTGRVERVDGLIVCRGLPRWAFRRGGTCVGRVYLTRDVVGERVLRHERVHVAQWRRYGFLFPPLYWAAGIDPARNRFEIEAGLEDGGYASAAGAAIGSPPAAATRPRASAAPGRADAVGTACV